MLFPGGTLESGIPIEERGYKMFLLTATFIVSTEECRELFRTKRFLNQNNEPTTMFDLLALGTISYNSLF